MYHEGLIKELYDKIEMIDGQICFNEQFCEQCKPAINYYKQRDLLSWSSPLLPKVPLEYRNLTRRNPSGEGFLSTALGVTYIHDMFFNVTEEISSKVREDRDPLLAAKSYIIDGKCLGFANGRLYDMDSVEPKLLDEIERSEEESHLIVQSNGVFAYELSSQCIYQLNGLRFHNGMRQ